MTRLCITYLESLISLDFSDIFSCPDGGDYDGVDNNGVDDSLWPSRNCTAVVFLR